MTKAVSMKASGGKTSDKAVVLSSSLTAALTRDNMKVVRRKVKVCIHGRTEKPTRDNSNVVRRRERVYGKEYMETLIWDSGGKIRLKGMEFTPGLLATVTKGSGEDVCVKETELISLRMVISILVNMQEASLKGMGNTNGIMVTNLLDRF
jgi:hypothetical protein